MSQLALLDQWADVPDCHLAVLGVVVIGILHREIDVARRSVDLPRAVEQAGEAGKGGGLVRPCDEIISGGVGKCLHSHPLVTQLCGGTSLEGEQDRSVTVGDRL